MNEISLEEASWEFEGAGDDIAMMVEYTPVPGHPVATYLAGRTAREMFRIRRNLPEIQSKIRELSVEGETLGLKLSRVMHYEGPQLAGEDDQRDIWSCFRIILSVTPGESGQHIGILESEVVGYGVIASSARVSA